MIQIQVRWNDGTKLILSEWVKTRRAYKFTRFGNTPRAKKYENNILRNVKIIILALKYYESHNRIAVRYKLNESTVSSVISTFKRFYITYKYKTTDTKRASYVYGS